MIDWLIVQKHFCSKQQENEKKKEIKHLRTYFLGVFREEIMLERTRPR